MIKVRKGHGGTASSIYKQLNYSINNASQSALQKNGMKRFCASVHLLQKHKINTKQIIIIKKFISTIFTHLSFSHIYPAVHVVVYLEGITVYSYIWRSEIRWQIFITNTDFLTVASPIQQLVFVSIIFLGRHGVCPNKARIAIYGDILNHQFKQTNG